MATTTMYSKPVYFVSRVLGKNSIHDQTLVALNSYPQRNVVPEPALVSEITHVSLAFISPSFDTSKPPSPTSFDTFFTDVDGIRAKFLKGTKVLWILGGWGYTKSFRVSRTEEIRRLFAKKKKKKKKKKAVLDATGVIHTQLHARY
jgi:hypothetical protein